MNARVSVIIPTKNRASYVFSAVKSVLGQTFGDFELIIVDAASTDNTAEVIRRFRDKRLRYIREDSDGGVSVSRNRGIGLSKGEFIAFLDDDDIWMPSKLEKQMNILNKHSSIGAVTTGTCVFNEKKEIVRFVMPRMRGDIFPKILIKNVVGNCSAVVARRQCLERAGLFDENLQAAEDFDMWIRLAKNCRFDSVEEYLLLCRTHSKQISSDYERVVKAMKMLYKKHISELSSLPFQESKKILAYWHYELGLQYSQSGATKKARKEFIMAVTNHFSVRFLIRLYAYLLNQRLGNLLASALNM